jgi:hypothetical protein
MTTFVQVAEVGLYLLVYVLSFFGIYSVMFK